MTREALTSIVFVATSSCSWRQSAAGVRAARPTVYRRFAQWSKAQVRARLHRVVPDELGTRGELDWSRRAIDSVSVRALNRGQLTGPNPTDRGKNGSTIHLLVDRSGLPIPVAISAANTHDSLALQPLVQGIPPVRSPRGPRRRQPHKPHGDKGYDYNHQRRRFRERGITPRIARRGNGSSARLGRHRWVVERTLSWLVGCRRLHRRYGRKPEHFPAFTVIATSLINYRRLTN